MKHDFSQVKYTLTTQNKSANFTKAICFCVDKGYLPFALFVAKQILELEENLDFDVCICLPDLSLVPTDFLKLNIRFVEIDINGFGNLPVGHLSLAAYYRLFLPHIFNREYEYIFYLDADTYILQPFVCEVQQLIRSLPSDFSVAAVADISELQMRVRSDNKLKKIKSYLSYYHQRNHIYRNSGVLLINVNNYIQTDCLERIFCYAFDENSNLKCHDQSALNGALLHEMAILPFTLNWQAHKLTYNLVDEIQPYIVHFIGENKPWSLDNDITKRYQEDYHVFLNEHYPSLANQVKSTTQKRLKNPKYTNKFRESFSINLGLCKTFLKDREFLLKKNNYMQKIKSVLSTPPFS